MSGEASRVTSSLVRERLKGLQVAGAGPGGAAGWVSGAPRSGPPSFPPLTLTSCGWAACPAWSGRRPLGAIAGLQLRRRCCPARVDAAERGAPECAVQGISEAKRLSPRFSSARRSVGRTPSSRCWMGTSWAKRAELEARDRLANSSLLDRQGGWGVAGLSAPLPSVEEVRSHMEWRRLLPPFRNLAGVHFQGRRVELERLRNYVGVLPPGSVAALVRRQPWTVLDFYARPPMVIHGPGGSGKSTLIARFLLEHAELPDPERFPFAYLDFDRVGLAPEEPLSLLAEIYRQLGAHLPTWKQELEVARAALVQRLRPDRGCTPAFASPGAASVPSLSRFTEREHAIALLARLLDDLGAREKPFLLVLDTFEEVQSRGPDYVHEVRHFLELLERSVPRLRTVLASRASVRDFPNEPMPLGTLDPEAADAFLAARGVADPDERSALRRLVGDSPLSLELAAQVMRVERSVVSGLAGGGRRPFSHSS